MDLLRSPGWLMVTLGLVSLPGVARAFCGFYVGGADAQLFNEASQVVIVRHGTTTVLSMQNHYDGPPSDFAMVVPVPVVLKKEDVKTLPQGVFANIDKLSAPRLVEYWEADPCDERIGLGRVGSMGHGSGTGSGLGSITYRNREVVVEAQFEVGEYEIVILSARDSTALDGWIREHGYKIPPGAEPYLRPYVQTGMKFFVAKVNVAKVKRIDGRAELSPLRFAYASDSFSLPIRLGLVNSRGVQDLIVYLVGESRFELANRENVPIPTNMVVRDGARGRFGELYAALFDTVLARHPGAAVTEYAWMAQSCDPCPGSLPNGLPPEDLMTLGGDLVPMPIIGGGATGPTLRYLLPTVQGELDINIVRRYLRQRMAQLRACYERALVAKPSLQGTVTLDFVIGADGNARKVTARGVDPTVSSCVATVGKSLIFPKPKGEVKVSAPLVFWSPGGAAAAPKGAPMSQVVVTRLHLRYGKDTTGEDLVFRTAAPLVGGTGIPDEQGKMGETAQGGANTFQGRYVMLHPWKGKMACAKPARGRWGGPPGGSADPPVEPARNLAFVKRGLASWRDLIASGLPSGL